MTNHEFKTTIERAFTSNGFKIFAKNLRFDGLAASILVGLQKLDYGEQYFINVGLWLHAIGGDVPQKVEHTHMYFRLERLFPTLREVVLDGGQLSHPEQPKPANHLASIIAEECIPALVELSASLDRLRHQFYAGVLKGGLVRKEARALLSTEMPASDENEK